MKEGERIKEASVIDEGYSNKKLVFDKTAEQLSTNHPNCISVHLRV